MGVRKLDRLDRRAHLLQSIERLAERPRHLRRHALLEQPLRHADAEADDLARQRRHEVGNVFRAGCGIGGVRTGNDTRQDRGVPHGVRQRADLIERRGEGEQAVARHAAVGRLEPHEAAERGRLADRPSRVRPERGGHEASRDRDGRPAARSAGSASAVPRVARRAQRRVLGGRSHRELVAVRLAHDHRAGTQQPLHDRGVVGRRVAGEHLRRGGGRQRAGADVVLECDAGRRRAGRGPRPESMAAARARAFPRSTAVKACRSGVPRIDCRERRLADLDGRDISGCHGITHAADGRQVVRRASGDHPRHAEEPLFRVPRRARSSRRSSRGMDGRGSSGLSSGRCAC